MENDYINPFDSGIESSKLLNLSSGVSFEDCDIHNIFRDGQEMFAQFNKERIYSADKSFHDPIPRKKVTLFSQLSKSVKLQKGDSTKTVEVNRNIIGKLLSISANASKPINFETALQYSLSPIPLSIANTDGTRRTTQKSKLIDILCSFNKKAIVANQEPCSNTVSAYIIDLIAQVRMLAKQVPDTFEHLTLKILSSIPKGYERVDLVADTYRESSIKTSERKSRGMSSKVIIKSSKTKVPRDFNSFLMNNDNKIQMIDLIFNYIKENRAKCLNLLRSSKIMLSNDNICEAITLSSSMIVNDLSSNQEEADSKVVLHAVYALNKSPAKMVIIRSPSADTDIVVLALGIIEDRQRVYFDQGNGVNRKYWWLLSHQYFLLTPFP